MSGSVHRDLPTHRGPVSRVQQGFAVTWVCDEDVTLVRRSRWVAIGRRGPIGGLAVGATLTLRGTAYRGVHWGGTTTLPSTHRRAATPPSGSSWWTRESTRTDAQDMS